MDILYGTSDIKMEPYENLSEQKLMLVNDLWEELKIESSINGVIMVMAGLIVGGLVGCGVFFTVRRRRRRKYVDTLWD